MSELYSWVLKIVGIVVIGVLIDIILPEGETHKYIKSIFACFVLFVIVSPLPKLLDYRIKDIDKGSPSAYVEIDDNFLEEYEKIHVKQCENKIKECLELENISVDTVEVETNKDNSGNVVIKKITIYLDEKSVMNLEKQHINIIRQVKDIIKKNMNVKEEDIYVYKK